MHNELIHEMRDEIKTLLNHIMGYSDILQEDAKDLNKEKVLSAAGQIRHETEVIKKTLDTFFAPGVEEESFDVEKFKAAFFSSLYMIVGLTQGLKKRCENIQADYFLPDVERILSSANRLFDFVERELRLLVLGEKHQDLLSQEAAPPLSINQESSLPQTETGKILLVDDSESSRQILLRHLERQGHTVKGAASGPEALAMLKEETFDLIILDYMMPGLSGYQVLKKIKEDEELSHLPVIMISALEELDSIVSCIELGAEDYLPKQFNPVLLQARIGVSLEKKRLRDQEQMYTQALLESQAVLARELSDAADYVRNLLPQPFSAGPVQTDWLFIPSAQLGGDCFNYYWVDEENLVFYLMDVSGHGIRAALLSVSIMNLLHSRTLDNDVLLQPTEVMKYLNQTFQMEEQNNMYFTLWYGVFNRKTRVLSFVSAGAPPVLRVSSGEEQDSEKSVRLLGSSDIIVGVDLEAEYHLKQEKIEKGDILYLLSDGVFEVKRKNGRMMTLSDLVQMLNDQEQGHLGVYDILNRIEGYTQRTSFDDDFSLIQFTF